MITIKKIDNISQIKEVITEHKYDSEIGRYRSSYLYRGMPNIDYHLVTSLQRNCKNIQNKIEKSILRNFTKYAVIEDSELKESVWRQLIIGQHYGLPTRLLDWTYSPLIGLHFATSGEDMTYMDQHDCVLWKIDLEEFNSLLPEKYRNVLENENAYLYTVEMLMKLVDNLEEYDSDMGDNAMLLLEPPSIDQRIINQYSYFSVVPSGIEDIEEFLENKTSNSVKYIIDKNIRWEIRDLLDQMNMNERIFVLG